MGHASSTPLDPLGGVVVVNGLVLTALLDGQLVALDRADGRIVWTKEAGGGINGWMSVAGDLLVVPVGSAQPPQVVAYRLGWASPSRPAAAATRLRARAGATSGRIEGEP